MDAWLGRPVLQYCARLLNSGLGPGQPASTIHSSNTQEFAKSSFWSRSAASYANSAAWTTATLTSPVGSLEFWRSLSNRPIARRRAAIRGRVWHLEMIPINTRKLTETCSGAGWCFERSSGEPSATPPKSICGDWCIRVKLKKRRLVWAVSAQQVRRNRARKRIVQRLVAVLVSLFGKTLLIARAR